ncbi:uncharacterized protein LOC130767427 isoform X2 [Actinidia eriantha]|uniref:uncharacterized protein LOC130767427 isoform X2 n=1 Tax=Actinidia eriantha TaxID=165200 RepID=UPI00258F3B3B|nr:uncharacterized protein LOC130767427 isoform X2 [Actinidia eriantha]
MMDLDEKPVNVDLGMALKGVKREEIVNSKVGLERELEDCRSKCTELEERSKKAEEKCVVLELEIEKRKSEFELLEGRFSALEVKKFGIEDEVKILKRKHNELEKRITQLETENNVVGGEKGTGKVADLTEEGKITGLMIENNVLECEKKKAESETEVWKLKCRELELRVLELDKEISILRGGLRKQTTKASGLKDGLDVVAGLERFEAEDKMANDNETIHAATGFNSTCCSPLKGIGDLEVAGTPAIDMPSKQSKLFDGRRRVRKQLAFGEENSHSKKMAPSTPGVTRPPSFGIIDISDSEDELANKNVDTPRSESQPERMVRVSTDFSSVHTLGKENKKTSGNNLKRTLLDQSDEEDTSGYMGNFPFISTHKRRRASNIVATDSEGDSDDNIPICKRLTKHLRELNCDVVASNLNNFSVAATVSEGKLIGSATPRRRLVTLRKCNVENDPEQNSPSNSNNRRDNYHTGIPTNERIEKDNMEEDGSESDTEGESLDGFIVTDSDVPDGGDISSASEDVLDDNVDFNEVLSTIRRSRGRTVKWEFEADMLASFGKDLELCMKAVCALYRQQTSEEKVSKGTFYVNQRGFSQCDAFRGTTLAEFLTDGDPQGEVKKSVKELQEYYPRGPELCRTLAIHYSKQLFAIYKNQEDPLFVPS